MSKDDFRFVAHFYDRLISPKEEIVWKEIICNKQIENLLDVGGGTGRVAQFLLDCAKKIYICDFSYPMLIAARSKNLFQEICCSIEDAPFQNSIFDCIVMVDALHHIRDQRNAIKTVLTLLKPGGIFILEEPDINHWQVKLIAMAEKLLLMRSHFLKAVTVKNWIDSNEFNVETHISGMNYFLVISKKEKTST